MSKQKSNILLKYGGLFTIASTVLLANVSGIVYRDFNLNGQKDTNEVGISNVTVKLYDNSGNEIGSKQTGSDGNYSIVADSSKKYRIEVSVPAYLREGLKPSVGVVNGAAQYDIGLYNIGQYCQANPNIIFTKNAKYSLNGDNKDLATLMSIDYNATYDNNESTNPQHSEGKKSSYNSNVTPNIKEYVKYKDTGSVYGLAYRKSSHDVYIGSFLKRHSDYKNLGNIYKYNKDSNALSVLTTLPINNSSIRDSSSASYDWQHDRGFDAKTYTMVGKTGIGDIELSEDEKYLYAVNMDDKKLYQIELDKDGNKSSQTSYEIPNPCESGIDFRPMGLGVHDGKVYVGITCTAESTVSLNDSNKSYGGPRMGDRSKLKAYIYSFDESTQQFSTSPKVTIPLDYTRGCAYNSDINATENNESKCAEITDREGKKHPFILNWLPWQMDYDIVYNAKAPGNVGQTDQWLEYPQPILSDIAFDNDGSMVIEISDINGQRTGYHNLSPDLNDSFDTNNGGLRPDGYTYYKNGHDGNAYGDIIRACKDNNEWTLENNASCGGITTGGVANQNQGLGGGEYYWYDNGPGGRGTTITFDFKAKSGHTETTNGGLLIVPGMSDVIVSAMDPYDFFQTGLVWFNNKTGMVSKLSGKYHKVEIEDDNKSRFGKANGIGDLEAICDTPPIKIGNYVWFDKNGNGIQDPNEDPIPNVKVYLYDGDTLIGTATTDSKGIYYFGGKDNLNLDANKSIEPYKEYQLRVDLNDSALNGKGVTLKDKNANTEDQRDNDADNGILNLGYATIAFKIGNYGDNNYSLDFGFRQACLGDRVWYDDNYNGILDSGEVGVPNIGVKLLDNNGNELNTTNTDSNGIYGFCNLPAGTYYIQFDKTTLPAGAVITKQNQGSDDIVDSDANPSDGKTNAIILHAGDNNTSLDMGIFLPACIGNYIWFDSNKNGIQDNNESGISGIGVKLYDGNNNQITQDAYGNSLMTETNSTGNYEFCNLKPGSYYVKVDTTNYQISPKDSGSDDTLDSDIDSNGKMPTENLQRGENNTSYDAGLYRSSDIGGADKICIGDYIWYDTNLNGIQDSGELGVRDVVVDLFDENGTKIRTTKTDNSGKYKFCNLEPNKDYKIKIHVPKTYNVTLKDKGNNDKKDSDSDSSGYIIVNKPSTANMTYDVGIYCSCESPKKSGGSALNIFGLLSLIIITLGLSFKYKEN